MGLDVDVYCGLTKVEAPKPNADGYPEDGDCRKFYDNPDFPGRIDGIEAGAVYKYEDVDEVFCGGYGGYNGWREKLAKLAGYPTADIDRMGTGHFEQRHDAGARQAGAGPFFELINFSDCEGTIGPVAVAKLAKDFADFQPQADALDDDYFKATYAKWRKGCEMAGDNGALDFH